MGFNGKNVLKHENRNLLSIMGKFKVLGKLKGEKNTIFVSTLCL